MKTLAYVKNSATIVEHLEHLGFSGNVQRKIGAFVVVWAMFEASLERAVWAIRAEKVKGVFPSTDKPPVSEWIKTIRKHPTNLHPKAQELIKLATTVAEDLLEYRNSIAHGHVVPYGDSVSFMRNPKWHGERRTRPSSEAHVDENLQSDITRVKSQAGELRHLSALMNHEKW